MTHPFDADSTDPEAFQSGPPPVPVTVWPASPRRRFYPVAFFLALTAWLVVLVVVVGAAVKAHLDQLENTQPATPANDIHLYQFAMEARYAVGAHAWFIGTASSDQFYEPSKRLFAGSIDQRLRFVVLAGELGSPEEALHYLDALDELVAKNAVQYSSEQRLQRDNLRKLYRDYNRLRYDAPTVPEIERIQLREQLGWFGELALAPEGKSGAASAFVAGAGLPAGGDLRDECPAPALRQQLVQSAKLLAVGVWLLMLGFVTLAFLGFVGLVGFSIMAFLKLLNHGVATGQSPAGVYIETFALWMLAFAGMSFGLQHLNEIVPFGDYRPIATGAFELLTLLVVFWPVLRGVPWKQVREDIGWTRGRQPILEPAAGVASWVMSMPVLVLGAIFILLMPVLQRELFGTGPAPDDLHSPVEPNHPITVVLARGDWLLRLQILFLASIVAPIVEETMFRGFLYRHLRELTRGAGQLLSVLMAAIVSSFVFAVIHPQGLMAVPVLMALALGFVLAREWRGTLVPGMVGHGLNNAVVLLVSIFTLGG